MKPKWLTKHIEDCIDAETARPGQLKAWDAIHQFVFAGNATFTLVSTKTGTRYTFKVRKAEPREGQPESKAWFVSLLSGPDNTSDYAYMGMVKMTSYDIEFKPTTKSRMTVDAPSWKAFQFFIDRMRSGGKPSATMEVWHEGHCGRCGRKLTVPSSVEAGIGPECAGKLV